MEVATKKICEEENLSPEADRTTRVTIGHAEGMPLAFANEPTLMLDWIVAPSPMR